MSHYDEIQSMGPMAFFAMGSTTSTEPDLMGGSAGTYSGSISQGQTPPFIGMVGGNAVTASGGGFLGGLTIPGSGTYDFVGTAAFSISYWINFPSVDTNFNRHLGNESGSNQGWIATHHPSFGIEFGRFTNAGTQEVYFADVLPITAATWYHYVGTYDGAQIICYCNGVQSYTQASTGSLPSIGTTLKIGGTSAQTKSATICDFGIWNRALTAGEAKRLYRAPMRDKVALG